MHSDAFETAESLRGPPGADPDIRHDLITYHHLAQVAPVLAPLLYVGDLWSGQWARTQDAWSVVNVLEKDLTSEGPLYTGPHRKHFPILIAGQAWPLRLTHVADWMEAQMAQGRPTLVHCYAGLERSPLTAAWALARRQGWSLNRAYRHIRQHRPQIEVRLAWLAPGWATQVSRG